MYQINYHFIFSAYLATFINILFALLFVRPLGSVVISLSTAQEIPSTIIGSIVGFFTRGGIILQYVRNGCFHVSLSFVHVLSCVVFGGGP